MQSEKQERSPLLNTRDPNIRKLRMSVMHLRYEYCIENNEHKKDTKVSRRNG